MDELRGESKEQTTGLLRSNEKSILFVLFLFLYRSYSKMPFSRYMEVGRVVLINYGPEKGKLAVVIDIVDQNKCLIDGPDSGVLRQVIPFTRIALTDFVVKVQRNARQKTLKKAWKEADIDAKWEATSWAKKLANRKKRASLNDFGRFKVMVAKKQKAEIIQKKLASM
jgi:large subunit ribosomal protein L14e